MSNPNRSDDNDLLAALRHPLRRRILREMDGRETASPSEVAETIGEPLPSVSYHVRVLADYAAITLVEVKPVRGSVQHFYRATLEKPWARQALGLDRDMGESPGDAGA